MRNYRSILLWSEALLLCLIMLSGRYDWVHSSQSSKLGYGSSAFLLLLSIPICHYLLFYYVGNHYLIVGVTTAFALLLTLPYRWLELEKFSTVFSSGKNLC